MKLDLSYPTISHPNSSNTLQLSPASSTKLLSQTRYLTNRTADGNRFDFGDFAD